MRNAWSTAYSLLKLGLLLAIICGLCVTGLLVIADALRQLALHQHYLRLVALITCLATAVLAGIFALVVLKNANDRGTGVGKGMVLCSVAGVLLAAAALLMPYVHAFTRLF